MNLKKIMALAAIAGALGFIGLGLGAGGVANAGPTAPGTSGQLPQDDDGWWGHGHGHGNGHGGPAGADPPGAHPAGAEPVGAPGGALGSAPALAPPVRLDMSPAARASSRHWGGS